MICGDENRFAIEYVLRSYEQGWAYGQFFYWISGLRFGDPDDLVHLLGSEGFARELSKSKVNLVNDDLYTMPINKLIILCGDISTMSMNYYKHHMSYIGFSSFNKNYDRFVLVKNCNMEERLVYLSKPDIAGEVFLNAGEFEYVHWLFAESLSKNLSKIKLPHSY
jgi:hypothetical protein